MRLGPSSFPVWVYDRASGAVEAANDAATDAYGGALGGRALPDVLREVEHDARAVLHAAHESVKWIGPLVHVRADGSTFLAEVGLLSVPHSEKTLVLVSPDDLFP